MAGSSESAFLFLDTKNGAIAPVVIIHLLLQQPQGAAWSWMTNAPVA